MKTRCEEVQHEESRTDSISSVFDSHDVSESYKEYQILYLHLQYDERVKKLSKTHKSESDNRCSLTI